MRRNRHWTESMFVDHSELFLPFLEDRLDSARDEAKAIKRILDERQVPHGGKVLDVCCGIGRHSLELAKLGYRLIGMDLAPSHIKKAEELAKRRRLSNRPTFVLGDMRNLGDNVKNFGKFDAAINMFTSFGYYGEIADVEFFKELATIVKKNGVLILETINRDWIVRNFQSTIIDSVKNIEVHHFNKFNFAVSHLENVWKFYEIEGEERKYLATFELNHRIYSAHELIKMLERSGWRDAEAYDGLGLGQLDFKTMSNRLVMVCRRQ